MSENKLKRTLKHYSKLKSEEMTTDELKKSRRDWDILANTASTNLSKWDKNMAVRYFGSELGKRQAENKKRFGKTL